MTDPEATAPPGTKADKILADLNRGEGLAARAAGAAAEWLSRHPHLTLIGFIAWTVLMVWAGWKIGRP